MRTKENIAAVSASVNHDHQLSIRRRSQQLGLCYSTTCKILRKKNLSVKPFKIQLVQELKPNDLPQRRIFGEWALRKIHDRYYFHSALASWILVRSGRCVDSKYTSFKQKKPNLNIFNFSVEKFCWRTDRQTDTRIDIHTDGQTDRRTLAKSFCFSRIYVHYIDYFSYFTPLYPKLVYLPIFGNRYKY